MEEMWDVVWYPTLVASSVLDVTYVNTIHDVLPTQALSIGTK